MPLRSRRRDPTPYPNNESHSYANSTFGVTSEIRNRNIIVEKNNNPGLVPARRGSEKGLCWHESGRLSQHEMGWKGCAKTDFTHVIFRRQLTNQIDDVSRRRAAASVVNPTCFNSVVSVT